MRLFAKLISIQVGIMDSSPATDYIKVNINGSFSSHNNNNRLGVFLEIMREAAFLQERLIRLSHSCQGY